MNLAEPDFPMAFSQSDALRETQMINGDLPASGSEAAATLASGNSEDRRTARTKAARRSAGLFGSLLVVLVVVIGTFTAYRQASEWVDHTHQVLSVVDQILSNLMEAESGQRGYLLTHEDSYLQPYLEGKSRISALLEQARNLTADNPTQQDNLHILRTLADAKLDELAVTLRQAAGDPDQAVRVVMEGTGERLMTQIQTVIANMRGQEEDLLLVRGSRAKLLEILMVVFTIALGVGAFWSVRSTVRRLNDDYEAERLEGAALADALRRNAMLLDEVNHRVKNSLQIVSNLLRTQALKNTNALVREQLLDSSGRVEAIAEVHRRLYGTDTYDTVELTELLKDITEIATPLTGTTPHTIIAIMPEPISLPVRDAIPVALVVNELLTNTFKHAFPDGRTGTIRLEVEHLADQLQIAVEDDGIGYPEAAEAMETGGFGRSMVRLLVEQVKGALEVHHKNPGTRFTLRLPYAEKA
jgi:two-component sensor histidine kinase/CHASE3 domain sensor protein